MKKHLRPYTGPISSDVAARFEATSKRVNDALDAGDAKALFAPNSKKLAELLRSLAAKVDAGAELEPELTLDGGNVSLTVNFSFDLEGMRKAFAAPIFEPATLEQPS